MHRRDFLTLAALAAAGCSTRRILAPESKSAWPGGAPAACSIVFDDVRTTHWWLAAPILAAHGMRATFALNTGAVGDWTHWQGLHQAGHEIASHSHTHPKFSDLSPSQVEMELVRAADLITEHIASPVSFVYPYGDAPIWSRKIVGRHHRYARGGNVTPSPGFPLAIPGTGYYAPFDLDVMQANLTAAVESGGWYVPYFHSLTTGPPSRLVCPVDIFEAHLEQIEASGVWVAPFREVGARIEAQG